MAVGGRKPPGLGWWILKILPMSPSPHSKPVHLLLALFALAAAVLLFLFDPATHSFYPRCPLHALTGLDCPTCGTLRAVHLLLHGNFRAAYALNPFLFLALPLAGLILVRPLRRRIPLLPWFALAILLVWFIFRNWT